MKSEVISKEVMSKIKEVIHKRIFRLIIILLSIEFLLFLGKKEILVIPRELFNLIDFSVFTIIIFLIITIVIRLTVSKIFKSLEKDVDMEQRIFLSKIYSLSIYLIGIALIFWKIGFSIANITIFLGFAATGIAFAIRDILLAFFAWSIILQKRPFRIGDIIKVGDDFGQVNRIGTFFVTLSTSEGNMLKIPNKTFIEKTIVNHGKKHINQIKVQVKKFKEVAIEGVKIYREAIDDHKYLLINFEDNLDGTKKQEILLNLEKQKII